VASQGTEATLFGLFRPYILAKFTLGALVRPLFRQFHDGVLGSSPQVMGATQGMYPPPVPTHPCAPCSRPYCKHLLCFWIVLQW
jgi:hypothetical protein